MSDRFYEDGDDPHEGYVREERAEECFIEGLCAMREMLARFAEQGGDASTAMSLRANWHPEWGKDPGRPEHIAIDCWGTTQADVDLAREQAAELMEKWRARS